MPVERLKGRRARLPRPDIESAVATLELQEGILERRTAISNTRFEASASKYRTLKIVSASLGAVKEGVDDEASA